MKTAKEIHDHFMEIDTSQRSRDEAQVTLVMSKLTDSTYAGKRWHSVRELRKYISDKEIRRNYCHAYNIIITALAKLNETFTIYFIESRKGGKAEKVFEQSDFSLTKGYISILPSIY